MAKEVGYFISIKDGDHGDTEAFIKATLDHDMIHKWAYILQDKEFYTQSDLRARRYGLQYNWASGFQGMEEFSSMEEYVEIMMKQPPYIGDRRTPYWRIVCITDKKCMFEDIELWFEIYKDPYATFLDGRVRIANELKWMLHEDRLSSGSKYHYPDEEVRSNFDFREYINTTKYNPKWERFKTVWRPAPLRPRRRRYLTAEDIRKAREKSDK
ncbi:MAG: hypothetical protein J6U54_21465 [Clostridiales bacterium]|nr:hypothetical protein [Clostridiales bacterium]